MSFIYTNDEYILTTIISNEKLIIKHILNINIFKIFFEVNKNIIDNFEIDILDETNCNIKVLLKHLFVDLGIKQQNMYLNIYHDIINNCFIVKSIEQSNVTNNNNIETIYPNIIINYDMINDHSYNIIIKISNMHIIDKYIQNIIGQILHKLINNLKQCLNSYTIKND